MAENKKSFILYADILETVSKLPDNKAGKLFKTILQYVNDQNPKVDDLLIQVAFEPIKQLLKRDLKKWEKEKEDRSKAGKIGMEKRWGDKHNRRVTKVTSHNSVTEPITEITDNVNVTVSVNDTVNERESKAHLGLVTYNAEQTILENPVRFEQMCMAGGKNLDEGKEILHKYHLYLEEKEQYPKGKKAVFAGFEKWLINEKKFNSNGADRKNPAGANGKTGNSKSAGAQQLVSLLKDEIAGSQGTRP